MILPLLAAFAGIVLFLLGIWRIHQFKEAKRREHGETFSVCPRYRLQRWTPIATVVLGILCTWGAGASTISAVHDSTATLVVNSQDFLVIEYKIHKLRECVLDRLWVEAEFQNGGEDVSTFDYHRIAKKSFDPDTVVVAIRRNAAASIHRIDAYVRYECALGFVVESQIASLPLPQAHVN